MSRRRKGSGADSQPSQPIDNDDSQPRRHSGLLQPKQSPQDRAELRSEYRKLIQRTESQHTQLVQPASTGLADTLAEADRIFGRVKKPREAALDAELLNVISQYGVEQSQKLQTGFKLYDADEFVLRLRTLLRPANQQFDLDHEADTENPHHQAALNSLDWINLGNRCLAYRQRTPALDCMLGPLSLQPTERKPRRVAVRQQLGPETQPEKVTEASIEDVDRETAARVAEVKQCLDAQPGPINYFLFVINPESFTQTVENIFHTSFMIKEGSARIDLDEEGLPVISSCAPPNEEDFANGAVRRHQTVIRMEKAIWAQLIELMGITKGVLPHRKPHNSSRPAPAPARPAAAAAPPAPPSAGSRGARRSQKSGKAEVSSSDEDIPAKSRSSKSRRLSQDDDSD
eukprot:TRINITY_DN14518_c0_g1_i1.p1 TRINITY_DN14518_c0_g1~~TRINITY_DN14518_c0_g1_i1.p1  ORF type:complete len:401 (+),score=59.64 TRINITY_DN14518_c0_g1_i1:74-1276(+)